MTTAHKSHKAHQIKIKAIGVVHRHFGHSNKHNTSTPTNKDEVVRFRLHANQKEYWMKAIKELGIDDLSSYARSAIERAIAQDLRSLDPKWQAFMKTIQPKAKEILGVELSDDVNERLENMDEIYKVLEKHHLHK